MGNMPTTNTVTINDNEGIKLDVVQFHDLDLLFTADLLARHYDSIDDGVNFIPKNKKIIDACRRSDPDILERIFDRKKIDFNSNDPGFHYFFHLYENEFINDYEETVKDKNMKEVFVRIKSGKKADNIDEEELLFRIRHMMRFQTKIGIFDNGIMVNGSRTYDAVMAGKYDMKKMWRTFPDKWSVNVSDNFPDWKFIVLPSRMNILDKNKRNDQLTKEERHAAHLYKETYAMLKKMLSVNDFSYFVRLCEYDFDYEFKVENILTNFVLSDEDLANMRI